MSYVLVGRHHSCKQCYFHKNCIWNGRNWFNANRVSVNIQISPRGLSADFDRKTLLVAYKSVALVRMSLRVRTHRTRQNNHRDIRTPNAKSPGVLSVFWTFTDPNIIMKTPESVFWGPRLPELSLITWVRSVT